MGRALRSSPFFFDLDSDCGMRILVFSPKLTAHAAALQIGDFAIRLRPAVAKKLPGGAHLFDEIEVKFRDE